MKKKRKEINRANSAKKNRPTNKNAVALSFFFYKSRLFPAIDQILKRKLSANAI